MSRSRRIVLPLAALAAGVAIGRGVVRRRPLLEPVNADLRNPILYVPLSLKSERVLRAIRSLPTPDIGLHPGVTATSRTIRGGDGGDLRVLVYEGAGGARPRGAVLWIHGGGLVLGTPEQGHALCSRWAAELGVLVISVDYRLAPDDPFPAGLEDCYAALQWLHQEAEAFGVDPARVAVGGDSAGGGLSAALTQLARDRGGPAICFQLLEYPMLDDRTVLREDHGGRGSFIWTPASNRFGWTSYLGRAPVESDAPRYAAPARTPDLEGLPPAWVGVGDLDLFYEEDVDYAQRLQAAGVPCELHIETGMYHGADNFGNAPTAKAFRDRMTAALASALQEPAFAD